jgi:multidrug efflux pump subunit AcrA (membrane-fusion protein)
VPQGGTLVLLARAETEAQVAEAEANAAQIAARLNLGADGTLSIDQVPDVANAKANAALAESEFARIQTLRNQNVVSQSEFDQRRTQVEAARQQYRRRTRRGSGSSRSARHGRSPQPSLADTSVRPFNGLVAERRVSVGDYVTRGAVWRRGAHQSAAGELGARAGPAQIRTGAPVSFRVDAPDRTFEGRIRTSRLPSKADRRSPSKRSCPIRMDC